MKKQVFLLILALTLFAGKAAGGPCGVTDPASHTVCVGSVVTLSVTASGGSNYTYQWQYSANGSSGWASVADGTPSGITYSGNTSGDLIITGNGSETLQNNYYRCHVDGTGCSGANSNAATITVVADPSISVNPVSPAAVCVGGSLSPLTVTASGGAPSLTYQWYSNTTNSTTGGTDLGSGNGAQTDSYTPPTSTAGTLYYYCVVSASGLGCDAATSTTATVTVDALPQGSLTANGPFCVSGAGQLTWTSSAGTGPYTIVYKENGGADQTETGVVSGTPFNTFTSTVTVTTVYTIQSVTDETTLCARNSGITGSSATITVYPLPQGSLSANGPFCASGSGQLTWTASEAGPGPYTIVYKENGGADQTATGVVSGTPFSPYTSTVTVTTAYTIQSVTDETTLCERNSGITGASATITINPLPASNPISGTGLTTLCAGTTGQTYHVTTDNSGSGYTYLWSYSGTNANLSSTTGPSITIDFQDDATSGTLTVVETETATGCTKSNTLAITVHPLPQGSLSANGPFCATGSGQLTWTASEAGPGPYTIVYKENGGADQTATGVVSGTPFSPFTSTVTVTTAYTIQSVTDETTLCVRNSGITGSSATITVNPLPASNPISGTGLTTLCAGTTGQSYQVTTDNSGSGYTYLWSYSGTGANLSSTTAPSITINFQDDATSGTLTVVETETATGCTKSNTLAITVHPLPQGSLSANGPFCTTGSGQLTWIASEAGPGPYTIVYKENGGADQTATGIVSGTPFSPFTSTVTVTTAYTIQSVTDETTLCARNSGITGSSATITINPVPAITDITTTVCSSAGFSVTPVDGVNGTVPTGTTYTWDSPVITPVSAITGGSAVGTAQLYIGQTLVNKTGGTATAKYTVHPLAGSCPGSDFFVTVTVNPEPDLNNLNTTVCSDAVTGVTLSDVHGLADQYEIVSITPQSGLVAGGTNATTGTGKLANAIASDTWTNKTGGALTVTYAIKPRIGGGCIGAQENVVVTINPEPDLNNLNTTICSDVVTGVTLTDVHSLADRFEIVSITPQSGLVAGGTNSTTGAGQLANAIVNDTWTNKTAGALTVTFAIIPRINGGCIGKQENVVITVNPEPDLNNLNTTVCSDAVTGVTLTDVHSLADRFEIVSITPQSGLVAGGGNATTGTGKLANAIANDTWTNKTAGSLTVTYAIIPRINGGCIGKQENVVITINPEPDLNNLNTTVCSDVVTGVTLSDVHSLADRFEIVSITPQSGLIVSGTNSSVGPGQLANAIVNDKWNNKTAGALTVTYAIIPRINGGCIGDQKNVVVTINPEPDLVTPAPTVCSNAVTGITLTDVHGLANSFEMVSVTPTGSITPGAGNATIGAGKLSSAITSDIWTNLTTVTQTVTYAIIPRIGGGCIGDQENIVVTVNPATTLTGASQLATVCHNSSATINLLGLLPTSTFDLSYSINGVAQTAITGLTADASGNSSFSTPALSSSLNGKILRVTGINVTSESPNCALSFTSDVSLKVDPATVPGTLASDQTICSGSSPVDLTLSGNTGTIVKWQKSIDSFANATDIPVTSAILPGSTIGNLTTNTGFRAVVQSGVCNLTYSSPVQVTINPLPVPTITGPAPVNVTSSGNTYTTETGKTSYSWNVTGAGNTITGGSGTSSITVTWNLAGDQAVTVNYVDANTCTAASPSSKTVHVNALPVASNITILGDPRSNITLNTFYSYSDAESDLEGTSVFQWYKGTDASGTGSTAIASAIARTYKLKDADTTYYIGFSVIPVAQAGATPGTMATSAVWVGPVTNAAPTASSVAISGSKNVGGVLTGHYTYSDLENDLESGTLFQWYSSTALAGPYNPITGEVYNTHLIENTEQGKYFQFRVTPKAATGKTTGYEVISASYGPANSQPYADNVTVSGSATIGSTLTGSYSYHDADGDVQGASIFRWLRTNTGGTTVISGATGLTYNLTSADEGYTITFEVTPIASTGYPTNGTPVTASTSGPVLDPSVSVPVADQVCISGIRKTGEILTGKYNYTFYKSEGTSGYRWLLNNTAIPGATSTQYTLTQSDIDSGQDIVFEVTPKSSNYIPKVGLAVKSTPLARIKITQTNYSLADTAFVLVPNVSGGVFSGVGVSNGYFSPWNADTAIKPPHTVKYDLTITNSITTCSERASVDITVVAVNAYFVGLNGNYCYDDKPDTIYVKNVPTYATNRTYKSTNPASIIKIINSDTIIIDPNKKRPGITKDTLSYSYLFNGSYYPITQSYTTDSVGVALINNLSDNQIFCNNDAPFTMYPSLVGAGGVFTGPVTPTVSGSYLLDPSKGIGNTSVTFKFTHANTGCFSAITVPITINPAPSVSFKPANVCVVNTSTDSIRFTNKTVSVDPVSKWLWEFFDAGGSSTKGDKNPAYLYKIGGDHRVTLKATTTKNCSAISDTTIGIGFRPVSNFRWKSDCYHLNDSIMFFDSTSSTVTILSRTWKFGTSPVVTVNDKTNPKFLKKDTGYVAVRYIVRTSYANCNDSVTKMVYIRPTIQLTTSDYFQNFESGRQGWVKDLEISNNTWSFGKPSRNTINSAASGNNAWFTNFDVVKQKVESSWINSPCFDFTTIKRPMVTLKIFRRFELNRDGGKIQYTIGDAGTWQAVGTVDDGINWYNSALIKGAPGGDGLGWTDSTSKWIESRHKLDELQGKKDVKFRIAYGSDGLEAGQYNDGFAFDDIRIGQRTRKVMLEHFTNAASKTGSQATSLVTDLANKGVKDIINIQYHADFPGTDKFFTFNPGEVSSRLLFYGLSRIPYAFSDGGTNMADSWSRTYSFTPAVALDSIDLIKRSLINPLFSITIDTTFASNNVTVKGTIKALSSFNVSNATLYIAVTEKQNSTQTGALGETKFYNIFRKFIPDASGIALKTSWTANDTYTLANQSWQINGIPNTSGIEVIAFIQNNITKEIYQAESVVKTSLNTVVGIDNVLAGEKNEFGLYPNPASDVLTITFMKKTGAGTEITIYDFKGSVIQTYKVGSGLSDYTINDTGLQNGIYLVRVKSGGMDLGYKKLIISRN